MPVKSVRAALIPLLTVTALLSACGDSAEPTAQAPQVPQVGVVTISAQDFLLTTELPGRTKAFRMAEVRPQVNGIIQKRLFDEGSEVKAGDQLYQIDAAVYEAALKSAEATRLSASTLADRYEILVKDRAVSQQAYDEARAARLQADAALERAKIDLRYTRVLAPISGRIGRSAVTEGALVSSGQAQALATIQQLDPIYVDVTQPSRDLLALRRDLDAGRLERAGDNAAKVTLQLEDGSQYEHDGKLEFSEVSVDAGTGSVTLRAVFPNPDRILLPGMFVHAQLVAGSRSDAILAPQQGVTRNPRGQAVAMLVTADNKVEQRIIQTERTVGNRWLVSEGLNVGDRLITEGLHMVQPGMQVEAVPAANVENAEPAAAPATAEQEG
ncbi:multidrug/solvent RND membrane fusion protein [Pseudomonas saudimassiliensis]|uniref:Multidrug/solvent RND membrane fusion protein n=1 Tax=Pseudomonas saudimassiliensis TaxID=1461581 RepID=A0A078MKP3_9PSED|nr:efflux RND transporter periplasmic adaptor subunit [Pseudomonas saudimassiliensis]CEA06845.1 multidrug/solvent RND membrane fusion protein [Pseudomonas saudimassiliensis]CEF28115.1 multidrug/solvent RND membrane fusion protein [Pseudomonas saudimassiliensis]